MDVKSPAILVAEDDEAIRKEIEQALSGAGYQVTTVSSAAQGISALQAERFDLIVTELSLPDSDSPCVLKDFGNMGDATAIVITESGTIKEAVGAIKMGAIDYLIKPFSIDEFLMSVERALEYHRLSQENIRLRRDIKEYFIKGPNIVGESEAMRRIFSLIERVAPSDSTLIILGESGTGKELVAVTTHYQSPRADKPLVRLNCAALPEGLIESELFGHEKGAFTGALTRKQGRFEQADGGTIFLDEIGDLPLAAQVKLLRVLQERSFERVGGTETIEVNVRVITATNKDLRSEVKAGRFREDLFFRLNVIPITVPPLRERKEDILPLIEHFLERYEHKTSRTVRFTDNALNVLFDYSFPGNVRELENIVERCATLSDTDTIDLGDLPHFILDSGTATAEHLPPLSEVVAMSERDYIEKVLRRTGGNRTKAAAILGISRKSLWQKAKKLEIEL
jgi:DNA-binding NtrC family response regulator